MFGKKTQSANDQFIMAAGRSVGNLKSVTKKSPTAKPPMVAEKSTKTAAAKMTVSARQKIGAAGNLHRTLKA